MGPNICLFGVGRRSFCLGWFELFGLGYIATATSDFLFNDMSVTHQQRIACTHLMMNIIRFIQFLFIFRCENVIHMVDDDSEINLTRPEDHAFGFTTTGLHEKVQYRIASFHQLHTVLSSDRSKNLQPSQRCVPYFNAITS